MPSISSSIGRVSNLQQSNLAQSQITKTEQALAQVQNELSTGLKVTVPSDAPGDAAVVMQLQKTLERRSAYSTNLDTANGQLSEVDTTLGDLTNLLQQAQNIASADVGSDVTDNERQADAQIVQGLYTQALSIANKQFNGTYLFGGDKATSAPFVDSTGGVQFVGSDTVLKTAVDDNATLAFQVNAKSVFGSLSSQVTGSADLTPGAMLQTRLADLGGAGATGVQLGSIQLGNGTVSKSIDLSSADNLGDVVNAINNAAVGGITASLTASGTALQLSTSNPTDDINVQDVAGGTTATDLGIQKNPGAGSGVTLVGTSLNPQVTPLTPLSTLKGGVGIDTTGIQITSGPKTTTISFAGAQTVEDLLNKINGAGAGVTAQINAAHNGIDILNATQGVAVTIGENGGSTATDLGVRSFAPTTVLSQLNDGNGVKTVAGADFQITTAAGTTFSVDLDSSQKTVQDVIDAINAASTTAGAGVTAGFATTGNGITLSDTSGGTGALSVTATNSSTAASDLGLTAAPASATQINGADVNPVTSGGLFTSIAKLRDSLLKGDQAGITAAGTSLQTDYQRVVKARGAAGAAVQEIQTRQNEISSENLTTQSLISSLQDADYAQTITQFTTLQTSLQATLQTQARVLHLSLLDFLS